MTEARFIVGIDLGTTHTVVACVPLSEPGAKPRIFPMDQLIAPGEIAARPVLQSLRYHPAVGELADSALTLPWTDHLLEGEPGPRAVGELAHRLGSQVPGRMVVSAKSWLSHAAVDRTAAILPWGAPDGVAKVSPVMASASYLAHVRSAWDHAHPRDLLADQEVVLTIPASFDEGARALTLQAAQLAGIPRARLLEEPQAAFYSWLSAQTDLAAATSGVRLALVVDVGGGTTDLTFIRVEIRESGPRVTRIAVGDHLMLGGDNMDLLLAHQAEQQLGGKLGPARFSQLLAQARAAKETLLGDAPPDTARLSVLGSGSKLIGGTLATELSRSEVEGHIVEGFLPRVGVDAEVQRRSAAIVEFGLPYVADAAITRHVAAFVRRHQDVAKEGLALSEGALALPDAVLLNGGVFRGRLLSQRMTDVLSDWRRESVRVLENHAPELAVALGAVAYGLSRRGVGMRIGGGSARSYFLLLGNDDASGPPPSGQGLCLLPRGAEEGEPVEIKERTFALKLGQPVRFRLASSIGEAAYVRAGELVDVDPELFRALPPIAAVLDDERGDRPTEGRPSLVPRAATAAQDVRVHLSTELTEIGTLEVSCIADDDPQKRWKLELALRGGNTEAESAQRIARVAPRFKEAKERIEAVFGKSDAAAEGRSIKTLRTDLEKVLGDRHGWTVPVLRELWSALYAGLKRRRRSADHERVWLNLVGFSLRPGYGYPLDEWRVARIAEIYDQGVQFAPEAQVWAEWWTLFRRIAGGLDGAAQKTILASLDYYLHPPTARPRQRPSGPKAQGYDDMVRLAASLERVSAEDKAKIGGWLIERLDKHGEGPSSWWAVGRIGARVPFYGSAHEVVPKAQMEPWLEKVLALDWRKLEPAAFAAVQLARRSGDRTRDIDEALRTRVLDRLRRASAAEIWIRMVAEVAVLAESEQRRVLGEALPPGLVLIDE